MSHPNAVLTPRGRLRLVELVEEQGLTLRQAAACLSVSVATAWEWVSRWRVASLEERQGLACLRDRSSPPHRQPRTLDALTQARIVLARRRTGWGPRLIAGELGMAHQSVWKVLRRHGCSQIARAPRARALRYEWPCPGDLLHMDTKRYARFARPGHAVTGERAAPNAPVSVQLRPRDHRRPLTPGLCRAARRRACGHRDRVYPTRDLVVPGQGSRSALMTDNAWSYTHNRSLAELLGTQQIRHLVTRPYRPQTNGKIERFHQTMAREWGHGVVTPATPTASGRCHTG